MGQRRGPMSDATPSWPITRSNQVAQSPDKVAIHRDGGTPGKERNTGLSGDLAQLHVDFHERFYVLGNECDGHDHDRNARRSGAAHFVLGGRSDPLHRADAALIAGRPVQPGAVQRLHDGRGRHLHLPLVGVAGVDRALRQGMRGKQQARGAVSGRLVQRLPDVGDRRAQKAVVRRIATDDVLRRRQSLPAGLLSEGLHRSTGGGGRELRIQRQQHDAVRPEILDPADGLADQRVPVTHEDEYFHLLGGVGDFLLQRLGLLHRCRQERGAAAHLSVDLLARGGAPGRDQPRRDPAEGIGHAQDRGIAEQVEQERADGFGRVRTAQVEDHHGKLAWLRGCRINQGRFSLPGLRLNAGAQEPARASRICSVPMRSSSMRWNSSSPKTFWGRTFIGSSR